MPIDLPDRKDYDPLKDSLNPDLFSGDYRGPDALGGLSLTVEEEDGSPSVLNVNKVKFDEDVGFVVTDQGNGVAHVGGSFGSSLTVEEEDGSPSVTAVTKIKFDEDVGFVVTDEGSGVAHVGGSFGSALIAGNWSKAGQVIAGDNAYYLLEDWDHLQNDDFDTGAFMTEPSDILTIPSTGLYLITFTLAMGSGAAYDVQVAMSLNDATPPFGVSADTTIVNAYITDTPHSFGTSIIRSLAATDVLRLWIQQNSGSNKDTEGATSMRWGIVKLA